MSSGSASDRNVTLACTAAAVWFSASGTATGT
jgi:hypothetical protein